MCVCACISFAKRKLMKYEFSLQVLLDQCEWINIWLLYYYILQSTQL